MTILTGQKCGVSKTIQCGMLTDRTGQGSNQGSLKQRENVQGFLVQVSIDSPFTMRTENSGIRQNAIILNDC